MITVLSPIRKTENNRDLSETLKSLEKKCQSCAPITPLECINRCQVYKIKNELLRLGEAMNNPDYIRELFNVLKNGTRLRILQATVNGRYSVSQLQQELKKAGHSHSQDTLFKEYLRPLLIVGLASETQDKYYATRFGTRVIANLGCFPQFAEKLPAHTECYEETLLQSMISGSKTFKEIEALIEPKTVSRTLKRLRSAGLIKTPKTRDYVFFFKSKRDPTKDTFTVTERKIYDIVTFEGISAGALADKTGFAMRIVYKYLRGLKGKKLVFTRKTPKTYHLTCKGTKLALVLQELERIVEDTWNSSQQVTQNREVATNHGVVPNAFS
jgi:DNA-binding HxlR family transcriptional regulator